VIILPFDLALYSNTLVLTNGAIFEGNSSTFFYTIDGVKGTTLSRLNYYFGSGNESPQGLGMMLDVREILDLEANFSIMLSISSFPNSIEFYLVSVANAIDYYLVNLAGRISSSIICIVDEF